MHTPDLLSQDFGTIERTPKVPALDGTNLNWLIQQFIYRCRSKYEPTTVDSYEAKLRWFVEWWEREGPDRKWMLRQSDFLQFEKYLREVISPHTKRKLAYGSRKDVFRRLGEALRWAQAQNYVSKDYSKWLPRTQGTNKKRRAAPLDVLEHLIESANQSPTAARDRAILVILIGMGLRRAEAASLNVEDLVFAADNSGHAAIQGKRTRAKADGQRDAAFDSTTGEMLITYLDAMGYEEGPLFRNRSAERLTPWGVYRVVKRLALAAGVADQIQGCHDLRRAFATHVYRQGQDSKLLKEQMGHTSFATTANQYILMEIDDIRVDLVSPIAMMRRGYTAEP